MANTPAAKGSKTGYRACTCQEFEMVIIHEDRRMPVEQGDQDPAEYMEFIGTGCRKNVAGKALFAPGHDAKLKSLLILALKEGNEVVHRAGGILTWTDPVSAASRFGFGHMVQAAADRLAAKATEKAPTVIQGTVKVGRWSYPARKTGDVVEYNKKRDSSGEWVAANAANAARFRPIA